MALGAHLATAAPDQATLQACTEIKNALPGKVLTTGLLAVEYAYEKQQYWSMTQRSTDPACIVQPVSAEDVSAVIKILLKYPTVKMATRSGGHDPNAGHNDVQDGVLITMTDMVGATYDATKGVAYVKPGGEWNDVIGDLEPSGVTMLGGRLGTYISRFDQLASALTSARNCWCRWPLTWRWLVVPQCAAWSRGRQHHRMGNSHG